MEALFLKLANMSITASWLVLAIIAVRLVFRKTPKWILCLLWGLVAVRLICPFSIESAMSLIPSAEPLPQEIIYTAQPQIHSGVPVIDDAVNPMLESSMAPAELTSANPTQIWSFILSQVWILGMVLMFGYTLVSYLLLKRKVATAVPLKRGIKQSEYVDSPFVLGILKPVIYLPFGMAETDMAYVIAHEKAHIRRRDHWWKPLGFLLLSVYWFNPVLWVAYILLCRDIEAACDEKVIRDMDKDGRRAYSTALLNCSIHRRRIAACPLAFGETGVKARVKSVMDYKKPAFWVILIAILVSSIVAVCFLTNPKTALPITMRIDYVCRTQAELKFVINESLAEEDYQISENYELETWERDRWYKVGRPEVQASEPIHNVNSEDADYDSWSLLNWEAIYGRLGDGTYRIVKEVTIYRDSHDIETRPIYAEFTIGGTADEYVTYTLEDITSTGAKLHVHETVDDEFQLVYGEGFWLEAWQDGQWLHLEPTVNVELHLKKDKYYVREQIFPSSHTKLDWSALYGELPDGTYRIAREVTNTAEDDLRICTAYVEFTISSSPVTITLENVRPTGARILFHQDQNRIDGPLICDHDFFLQQLVHGTWEDLPKLAELPFPDQTYDIAVLHHHGLDWKQMYGTLPIGSYRLGKEIPVTSGEHPEYTTVFAEFSIGTVYTWFDGFSTNLEEHHPKDNTVDLFGMEHVFLSYGSSVNEIRMVTANGTEPIISADLLVRSAFLTDLTGDDVAEVCANVQTSEGIRVQVYDGAEKKLYEMPRPENGYYVLSRKADRLCVLHKSDAGIIDGYGQLSLNADSDLEIVELEPQVQILTERIVCVDVDNRKHTCLSRPEQIDTVLTLLRNLKDTVRPASQEELTLARADTFKLADIKINYELGEKVIVFSENFDVVWEYGSREGYVISDQEPIRSFITSVTDGVRDKETSGEPFATVDAPWDWVANLHGNAVSTAEIYACLDKSAVAGSSSVTTTNGILPLGTLQKLIAVLNQIPKDAFSDSGRTTREYRWFVHEQSEGTCTVSFIDGVNQLAVALRLSRGNLEMLLTKELEKAQGISLEYLSNPATVWRIEDTALREFLEGLAQEPPVINYSVGAEYEWQSPMTFAADRFCLTLRLIEDWEYERVANADNSGIRCRPEGITDGWIYFSFWPGGYEIQEEDRFYLEGETWGFPSTTSYPSSVKSRTSYDVRYAIWSYQAVHTDNGDYVIINDGADDWFQEYRDQISDMITYTDFSVK